MRRRARPASIPLEPLYFASSPVKDTTLEKAARSGLGFACRSRTFSVRSSLTGFRRSVAEDATLKNLGRSQWFCCHAIHLGEASDVTPLFSGRGRGAGLSPAWRGRHRTVHNASRRQQRQLADPARPTKQPRAFLPGRRLQDEQSVLPAVGRRERLHAAVREHSRSDSLAGRGLNPGCLGLVPYCELAHVE